MNFLKRHGLKFVLAFYAMLHIAQLEFFPFYHFAMYSQRIDTGSEFTKYTLLAGEENFDFSSINYRSYIYFTNTFKVYDDMLANGGCQDNAQIIQKYFNLLQWDGLAQDMISKSYCSATFKEQMQIWIRGITGAHNNRLYRVHYTWPEAGFPVVKDSIRIL